MPTIDIVSNALLWCDNCGSFLMPHGADGHSRPGVRLEVHGMRVVLCSECVMAMAAALAAQVEAERENSLKTRGKTP